MYGTALIIPLSLAEIYEYIKCNQPGNTHFQNKLYLIDNPENTRRSPSGRIQLHLAPSASSTKGLRFCFLGNN